MATTIDGYLDAIKTILEGLETSPGVPRFASGRVIVQADFSMDAIQTISRYPTCVLVDEGGSLNRHNGQYWERRLAVFVMDTSARDNFSSKALSNVLAHVEAVSDALRHEYTAGVLTLQGEDGFSVSDRGKQTVQVRALTFQVVIRRSS